MKTSETISKIMPDLVKAQTAMGAATKDAINPFFHSKYADLGSVIKVCKDLLNFNGIVYLQPITGDTVQTIMMHTSGEWISDEGTRILFAKENDPQAQGSAITYARRYGLQSFLGIPAEDDDGEKAKTPPVTPSKVTVVTAPKEPIEDVSKVCTICGDAISTPVANFSMSKYGKHLCMKHQVNA